MDQFFFYIHIVFVVVGVAAAILALGSIFHLSKSAKTYERSVSSHDEMKMLLDTHSAIERGIIIFVASMILISVNLIGLRSV